MGRVVSGAPPVRFHVGDRAVARIAARAARRVPGVVALRPDLQQALLGIAGSWTTPGAVHPDLRSDGVVAAVHDGSAEVSVTLEARLGFRCRDLAAAVRRAVADEVRATTGLAATVRVTVADVRLH